MFYQGTLQDGINLALSEAKAVICFVREDTELSEQWEKEYFGDDEVYDTLTRISSSFESQRVQQFAQSLKAQSVILRLTAGSQEAGFLASLCPLVKFPAVVVIKNGSLREYFVPEISKDDFRKRLVAALEGNNPLKPIDQSPGLSDTDVGAAGASAQPVPAPATEPNKPVTSPQPRHGSESTERRQSLGERPDESTKAGKRRMESVEVRQHDNTQRNRSPVNLGQLKKDRGPDFIRDAQGKKHPQIQKSAPKAPSASSSVDRSKEAGVQQTPVPTPPKQYRLQVRLFDGSTVRSSFSPSTTIRKDIRSWLDEQLTDDTPPYNLKHILTPLPNRTISVAEEDKSLEELGLGPSANLVMVTIPSYTRAYASSAVSAPIQAVSSVCNLLYSAASSVPGFIGSLLGYGTATPTENYPRSQTGSPSANSSGVHRSHPTTSRGSTIRTLRDQHEQRDDNQLYNGNQLNFEPRKDPDGEQS